MTQHDSSYHLLFSHPELVEDLLRNFVPEDWVTQLDLTNMERVNAKFHTEGLDQRDGDLIYRIRYKEGDGEIYLYLLLEFQSTPDKWMALRFSVYVGLLYEQLRKEGRLHENKLLPPVFPLLLYNGDKPWNCPQDLSSLIALPPNSPLQKWQPQMCYYLLDESQHPDGKEGSITGALFQMENTNDYNTFQDILRVLDEQISHAQSSLRRALVLWIRYVIAPHKGLKLKVSDTQDLTEVREMLSTRIKQWEQDFLEKGLEKGREEGLEKGLEKGLKEGEARTLTKMLELKFGDLPDWAKQQITQADTPLLDQWVEKLLDATCLEDVFK